MAQVTSGKVLREARERKGYDLNTVARRLRIRPDILRAIEAGDFAAMPPRGYTRNMINAYSRLLGLNPTEIVNMYLDEAYANQVERARGTARGSGFNMERDTRRSRSRNNQATSVNRTFESGRTSTIRNDATQTTRVLYDDGTRYARDDYGVTRERTARPGRSDRDFLSHHSGYDSSSSEYRGEASRLGGQKSVYAGQTPNTWKASRLPEPLQNAIEALQGVFQSRVAIIVAAAIVVLLLAGIAFAVTGSRGNDKADDASQLPVSGVADTTGDDSSSSSAAAVELAPTSARVIYSVPSGKECYVETYLDGQMTPEMLTGPVERSLEVTGVWVITTYSPETLNLTVDGTAVTMKVDQQYNGMYSYTVDFPAILQKWNTEHGKSGSSATTSTSTSNATASGAAASTQSGSSASAQTAQQTYEESVNYDTSLADDQATADQDAYDQQEQDYYDETQQPYEEEAYDEGQTYYEEPQQEYQEPVYTEEYAEDYTDQSYDDVPSEQY